MYENEVEGKRPLIKPGFTYGRLINLSIIVDYFLIMLASLIAAGTLGALNHKVCFISKS